MRGALSLNALSVHLLSSSKKSDSDFVLGSNVSLCHLCLGAVCDSDLVYSLRNTISTSSRAFLFHALLFLSVWSDVFRK